MSILNDPRRSTFETYQSAWRTGIDVASLQRLLKTSVAEDCIYNDPTSQCHGYSELIAKIEDSAQKFPAATFRIDSFLQHHEQALIGWTMLDGKGSEFVTGASYVQFGDDGRLTHMTGFFESPKKDFEVRAQ